ncbi:MAG: hypothetical protein VX589_07335 [Myxococcota bacterium]|nr:hypothetical protein [Myxococcota bacterium]
MSAKKKIRRPRKTGRQRDCSALLPPTCSPLISVAHLEGRVLSNPLFAWHDEGNIEYTRTDTIQLSVQAPQILLYESPRRLDDNSRSGSILLTVWLIWNITERAPQIIEQCFSLPPTPETNSHQLDIHRYSEPIGACTDMLRRDLVRLKCSGMLVPPPLPRRLTTRFNSDRSR